MKINTILKRAVLLVLGGVPMVVASVPSSNQITNDTALYQELHEINVKKVGNVNFDNDINRLSAQEKSHHEALPVRISGPMARIEKASYRPSKRRSIRRR
jgi:hypothetical protein